MKAKRKETPEDMEKLTKAGWVRLNKPGDPWRWKHPECFALYTFTDAYDLLVATEKEGKRNHGDLA